MGLPDDRVRASAADVAIPCKFTGEGDDPFVSASIFRLLLFENQPVDLSFTICRLPGVCGCCTGCDGGSVDSTVVSTVVGATGSTATFDADVDEDVSAAEDEEEYRDCRFATDAAALLTTRTDVLCRKVLKKLEGPERDTAGVVVPFVDVVGIIEGDVGIGICACVRTGGGAGELGLFGIDNNRGGMAPFEGDPSIGTGDEVETYSDEVAGVDF